jgi:hypothetical protein
MDTIFEGIARDEVMLYRSAKYLDGGFELITHEQIQKIQE